MLFLYPDPQVQPAPGPRSPDRGSVILHSLAPSSLPPPLLRFVCRTLEWPGSSCGRGSCTWAPVGSFLQEVIRLREEDGNVYFLHSWLKCVT